MIIEGAYHYISSHFVKTLFTLLAFLIVLRMLVSVVTATGSIQLSPEIAPQRGEAPGGKAETLAPPGGNAPDQGRKE